MKNFQNENVPAPVSVIIPCFRNARTIKRAVHSVANQTMRPKEVIIVDDASDDDTPNALLNLQNEFDDGWIQIITLAKNNGPAEARNAGWEAAAQPYLAFLDADDSWHPEKIARQYSFMQAAPEIVLTGHNYSVAGTQSIPRPIETAEITATRMTHRNMFYTNPFATPSIMLKNTDAYRFRNEQHYMEDYLLWLQIYLDGAPVYKLDAPLTYLHKPFGASGLSSQTLRMQKANLGNWWILHQEKRLSLGMACIMSLYSTLKYLRRIVLDISKNFFQKEKCCCAHPS